MKTTGWSGGRVRGYAALIALTLAVGGCAGPVSGGPVGACGTSGSCGGAFEVAERRLEAVDSLEALYSLTIRGPGLETTAYLRLPRNTDEPVPAIVLAAGRFAGKEAANVVPRPLRHAVLAVEYPGEIPQRLLSVATLRRLPQIRRVAETMPDVLVHTASVIAAFPEIDGSRIGLMGVSFGVLFAAVAGADHTFSAVVLAFGGAGLREIVAANLPVQAPLLRGAASRALTPWLARLEPERHVGGIAPKPLLIISAAYDELIPRPTAERLREAARPPVSHVWLPTKHIGIRDTELIAQVAHLTTDFFEAAWDDGAEAWRPTPVPTGGTASVPLAGSTASGG